jgi:hypothetical protein
MYDFYPDSPARAGEGREGAERRGGPRQARARRVETRFNSIGTGLAIRAPKPQNKAGLQRSFPLPSQYPCPMWQQPVAVFEQA